MRCDECLFFDVSLCRRYPPAVKGGRLGTFPAMSVDGWCGEFDDGKEVRLPDPWPEVVAPLVEPVPEPDPKWNLLPLAWFAGGSVVTLLLSMLW